MPCNSSPAPASISKRKKSTIECTAVSDCPTPTVSTKMTSNPAASHKIIVSRVLRATPPNEPAEGEGRMYAFSSTDNSTIRVLSPKILPFVRSLLGSIANTASVCFFCVIYFPNDSINVLFPAPGTPVIPIRIEFPEKGKHSVIIS